MNVVRKELRDKIRAYFGHAVNNVKVFKYSGHTCVDVEYEDFYSESRVERDVRAIIGDDCLLNVKREFSDSLLMEMALIVVKTLPHEANMNIIKRKPNYYEWMASYEKKAYV